MTRPHWALHAFQGDDSDFPATSTTAAATERTPRLPRVVGPDATVTGQTMPLLRGGNNRGDVDGRLAGVRTVPAGSGNDLL